MARILFQLSGSIAAAKATQAVSDLVKRGHEVRTVLTRGGERFVGPALLEGLTGHPPLRDLWEEGRAMDHIELARWSELTVLCPASASRIARLAHGLADDAVGALFLAHDLSVTPYWVVPAMNWAMLRHPATQASLARLRGWGVRTLEGEPGALACGETGPGRMLEPEALVAQIQAWLAARADAPGPLAGRRVLVTAGGTRERVDGVRVLTNSSTGATGVGLAEELAGAGARVRLLLAQGARDPKRVDLDVRRYSDFGDLERELAAAARDGAWDGVVHLAAVSDFSVRAESAPAADGKLDSAREQRLLLTPNPKLVDRLREQFGAGAKLVAFKLTDGAAPDVRAREARGLLERARLDAVVHNDLTEISGASAHPFTLWRRDDAGPSGPPTAGADRTDLARRLTELLT